MIAFGIAMLAGSVAGLMIFVDGWNEKR